jgi:hypothetical protein
VRTIACLLSCLALSAIFRGALAQDAAEHRIKAAFLSKFGAYVEWPARAFAGPDSPIRIGVIGDDAIAAELTQLTAGRQVAERGVLVRRMQRGEALDGLHILFVGRTDAARLGEILAKAKGQPLLTVTDSDSDDALARGSIINFVLVQDRVRFDVATAPAEHGNLKISSRLLGVARQVRTN